MASQFLRMNNQGRNNNEDEGVNGAQGHQARNVRQRVADRPDWRKERVDLTLENLQVKSSASAGVQEARSFSPRTEIISLASHMKNGPRHRTAIIAVIMSLISAGGEERTQVQQRRQNNQGQSTAARYQRRMQFMCLKSPSGSNMFIMFHGCGNNPRLLECDVSLRYNGTLRPGALVAIVNPPLSDKFLGGSSTPILTSGRPLMIVHDNFNLPERPITANGTDTNGCILPGLAVTVNTVQVDDTGCNGSTCDQQSLMIGNVLANRCSCMQMDKSEKVMCSWTITVLLPNGSTFQTRYTSKWFMKNFIYSGPLPVGTRASDFEPFEVEEKLFGAFEDVCGYINDRGGFRAMIWVKRGQVQDQGVDQPNNGLPYNAARATVESGILNHHIVRLEPMTPEAIDLDELNNLKFNVSTGFHVQ